MKAPLDLVRDRGGPELVERLLHLEATRGLIREASPPRAAPDQAASLDTDVLIAGGGLSLLLAPALVDRGLKVTVVERGRAGVTHREWNASGPELEPLWTSGVLAREQVESAVLARYETGVCRWFGGGAYAVPGVLDHAVDAGRLLQQVRRASDERGVVFLERHEVVGELAGPGGIAVSARPVDGGPLKTLSARLMIDARGAASPYASADLVCPTVGGVLQDLEVDPKVGDILATVDDAEDGRQHVWEGFPGRARETTVYLFYYARSDAVPPDSLLRLYARFFETRPRYAKGEGAFLRPTFGYIPGWSRLVPSPKAPGPRVALFGDAAARHSALTYCGFGSMLRRFVPAADAIQALLQRDDAKLRAPGLELLPDEAIHAGTGALSALMSRPSPSPHALNALLDAAFGSLAEMGPELYGALLRDQMAPRDFVRFLRHTSKKHPAVYREVFAALGARSVARWGASIAGSWMRSVNA